MADITSRKDIELLVDHFYTKVLKDELIGHFFTKVVQLDWDKHFPIMYDFWETTLLGHMKYKGNPMLKHIQLNAKSELKSEHFDRWLKLWKETIERNFHGPKSEEMIQKAQQIGALMKYKVTQQKTPK